MNDLTGVVNFDIAEYSENSYLNYSNYVINERALPSVKDGLKPVHRRIIFAMSELDLSNKAKYKKSARTIGDVLGKYHPHGDTACYESMALMAQNFSYRYPLVDGQGNWGSQDDPSSFAAMRYTESRMTRYADLLLSEIKDGSTDFTPNFDGTLMEPEFLPARVPNILLNDNIGVAVGMATEIPSHNIVEVVNAVKVVIDNPNATVDDILDVMPGPDYPTGGYIVSSRANLKSIYETGTGTLRLRAKYVIENETDIVITELPFKVSGEKVIESIGNLMLDKKLPMIDDIRDESDQRSPVRIVIILKPDCAGRIDKIADHIFSVTDLEKTKKVIFNFIGLNDLPGVRSINEILAQWISFRKQSVVRALNHRISKIVSRLHLIDGLMICYLNLDRVIEIIRSSDTPKSSLMDEFKLSEPQADYILDTRLRNLAKLDEMDLTKEQKNLIAEKNKHELVISSDKRLSSYIKHDLDDVIKNFTDDRRCEIADMEKSVAICDEDIVQGEPITVIISKNGWIRSGKGHQINPSSLQYKVGDMYGVSLKTLSNKEAVLFDNAGRSFCISSATLPSAKSFGDPISTLITPESGSRVVDIFSSNDTSNRFVYSEDGYGFICEGAEFLTRQKKGKVILNCESGFAMPTVSIEGSDALVILTKSGLVGIVLLSEFSILKKGKGLKIVSLGSEDSIVSITPFSLSAALLFTGDLKEDRLTQSKFEQFIISRAGKPKKWPRSLGAALSVREVE